MQIVFHPIVWLMWASGFLLIIISVSNGSHLSLYKKHPLGIYVGVEDLDDFSEVNIDLGKGVMKGTYPQVVAVFNAKRKYQSCAGFLLTTKSVLAGGYCVSEGDTSVSNFYVSVLGGVADMRDRESDQWRTASEIVLSPVRHKEWPILAVIRVNKGFRITFSLKPTYRIQKLQNIGDKCTSLAWNTQDRLYRLKLCSLLLDNLKVQVSNQSECERKFQNNIPEMSEGHEFVYFCGYNRESKPSDLSCMFQDLNGSLVICEDRKGIHPVGIAVRFYGTNVCRETSSSINYYDLGAMSDWINREIGLLPSINKDTKTIKTPCKKIRKPRKEL